MAVLAPGILQRVNVQCNIQNGLLELRVISIMIAVLPTDFFQVPEQTCKGKAPVLNELKHHESLKGLGYICSIVPAG
jgi:hypothetical protein